jgi:hypothetical protein
VEFLVKSRTQTTVFHSWYLYSMELSAEQSSRLLSMRDVFLVCLKAIYSRDNRPVFSTTLLGAVRVGSLHSHER